MSWTIRSTVVPLFFLDDMERVICHSMVIPHGFGVVLGCYVSLFVVFCCVVLWLPWFAVGAALGFCDILESL